MTYHNCISLYLFFIFVLNLFLEIESFTPTGRLGHSSILVGNKLYFFGGMISIASCSNEVFNLDVSQQFNITSLPWSDLTVNDRMPTEGCWGAASLIVNNNEQNIYIFGGNDPNINTNVDSLLVYKFNLNSEKWEMPIIKGKAPARRMQIKAISNNSGKTYIFGGHYSDFKSPIKFYNDMVIFNDAELSWSISYLFEAPTLAGYSATLLSNGIIVYIGGFYFNNGLQMIDISQINLYDTKSFTWSVQKTNLIGQIDDRCSHTAVLASDGRIIIYGGSRTINNFQVTPNLVVLNTSKEPFEWTIPLAASNIGAVPSLIGHTANLVGNYMIIAFGNITQQNAPPTSASANIYIMDIRSYTWVSTFEPPTPSTPIPATTDTLESRLIIGMGIAIGIIGFAILIIIGFFVYKRHQRRQREKHNEIIRIPGNISK